MKVKELIAKLQHFDLEKEVLIRVYEDCELRPNYHIESIYEGREILKKNKTMEEIAWGRKDEYIKSKNTVIFLDTEEGDNEE